MMTERDVEFSLFDRNAEVDWHARNLPHWFQPGVAVFVTFRTLDSMPRKVVADWHRDIRRWLLERGFSCDLSDDELPNAAHLPGNLQSEYRRVRDQGWHQRLDQCHGACVLRDPRLGKIVAESLLHFDGIRYHIASYVVMPNHVHLIVQFRRGYHLRRQTESWLRFTATRINRLLGQTGPFWQSEPFDHLIRSEAQFVYLLKYIRDNPANANLKPGESIHYSAF